jgi:hypothetical protein
MKHGPAGSKQDGSGNEDQPCVHGRQGTRWGDLKDCQALPDRIGWFSQCLETGGLAWMVSRSR